MWRRQEATTEIQEIIYAMMLMEPSLVEHMHTPHNASIAHTHIHPTVLTHAIYYYNDIIIIYH